MIAEFSLLLTCGMSLMWCLMPRRQVTAGFFRIQMLIAMGLGVLAVLTLGQFSPGVVPLLIPARVAAGFAVGAAYVGSICWLLDRRSPGTVCMAVVAAGMIFSLFCLRGGVAVLTSQTAALRLLSDLSTAAVMGGAVTGMLLGHWYLTAPTMSIEPLRFLCWCFAAAVVVRLVVSAVEWFVAGALLESGVQWTWLALRWLAGILGPLAISVMALRILRYRNTQAATGVLFAGVILTFIGEMSAALLYAELKAPF